MEYEKLIRFAIEARKRAYCPYSNYAVGASLLAKSGKIYNGSNIENKAHSPTVCAERTAFFKAVLAGEREFCAIAVAGGNRGEISFCPPCGVCRQVMTEFCGGDFKILVVKSQNEYSQYTLLELLPFAFGRD